LTLRRIVLGFATNAIIVAKPEEIFGTLNHCACRTDLALPDSSRRLEIDDDRRLQIIR
jgi:hypothetical protein